MSWDPTGTPSGSAGAQAVVAAAAVAAVRVGGSPAEPAARRPCESSPTGPAASSPSGLAASSAGIPTGNAGAEIPTGQSAGPDGIPAGNAGAHQRVPETYDIFTTFDSEELSEREQHGAIVETSHEVVGTPTGGAAQSTSLVGVQRSPGTFSGSARVALGTATGSAGQAHGTTPGSAGHIMRTPGQESISTLPYVDQDADYGIEDMIPLQNVLPTAQKSRPVPLADRTPGQESISTMQYEDHEDTGAPSGSAVQVIPFQNDAQTAQNSRSGTLDGPEDIPPPPEAPGRHWSRCILDMEFGMRDGLAQAECA